MAHRRPTWVIIGANDHLFDGWEVGWVDQFICRGIAVPIGVAANVSGSTVAVIAEDVAEDGVFDCTARTSQDFPIAFRR
jgi:hypothetical protein